VNANNHPKPALLIVDDEPDILFILTKTFDPAEYSITTAIDGAAAIEQLSLRDFQLVLLDLNMQPVNGLQVLSALRQANQETVVIILTAYSTLDSAIEAIRLGAFDYLVKPVDTVALRKRTIEGLQQFERNHQLIQQQKMLQDNHFQYGDLKLDLVQHTASLNGRHLDLTSCEFKLLLTLAQAAPQPLTPLKLVSETLGYQCTALEAADIIKFHIHHLRQKVEPDPQKPQHIKTVRFEGYMWGG
jgi:DNA-binding response OmpR family regulator